jgi:hypothetical protein
MNTLFKAALLVVGLMGCCDETDWWTSLGFTGCAFESSNMGNAGRSTFPFTACNGRRDISKCKSIFHGEKFAGRCKIDLNNGSIGRKGLKVS